MSRTGSPSPRAHRRAVAPLLLAIPLLLASGAAADATIEILPFSSYYEGRMEPVHRAEGHYEISQVRGFPIYYVEFTSNDLRSRAFERMMIFVESDVDHGRVISPARLFEVMSEYGAAAGYDLDVANVARFFSVAQSQDVDLDPMEAKIRESLIELGLLKQENGQFTATRDAALLSITAGLDEAHGAGTTAWIRDHEFRHGFYYTELRLGIHAIWEGFLTNREQAIVAQTIRLTAPYDPTNESLVEREFYSMIFEERFEANLRKLPTSTSKGDERPTAAEVKWLAAKLRDIRDQFSALEALLLGGSRR